jgi:archaemetzincin
MTTMLFYLSGAAFLLVSLYRLVWHHLMGGLGGLATVPGRVVEIRQAGVVAIGVGDGRLLVDPGLAQVPSGIQPGQRVTVALLDRQPVRLIRARVPSPPRWLHWPQLASGLLCLLMLSVMPTAEEAAAEQAGPVKVGRRIRAPAASSRSVRAPRVAILVALQRRLHRLDRPMGPVRPGDWLAHHREPGQTFRQYLGSGPVHARGGRKVIYIQPIGPFRGKQRRVLDLTADFMSRYFCLEVRVARPLPLSLIPASARRRHPTWGMKQILTTHVLDVLLRPRRPRDAAVYIGFTASDLWPGRGWNFVFGQASLRERVGVWSIHRNGDPERHFNLCLLRTIKTAVHETGHMLSMWHCTAHRCNMNGSNSLDESDRGSLALCSECAAKLLWATGCDARTRYEGLAAFASKHGLAAQARAYRLRLEVVGGH